MTRSELVVNSQFRDGCLGRHAIPSTRKRVHRQADASPPETFVSLPRFLPFTSSFHDPHLVTHGSSHSRRVLVLGTRFTDTPCPSVGLYLESDRKFTERCAVIRFDLPLFLMSIFIKFPTLRASNKTRAIANGYHIAERIYIAHIGGNSIGENRTSRLEAKLGWRNLLFLYYLPTDYIQHLARDICKYLKDGFEIPVCLILQSIRK